MKKQKFILTTLVISVIVTLLIIFIPTSVKADTVVNNDQFSEQNLRKIYDEAVARKVITSESMYPFEYWKEMEKTEWRNHYTNPEARKVLPANLTYIQWMRDNNYGLVVPMGDNPNTISFYTSGQQANINAFISNLTKGDILICSGGSPSPNSPYIGHAAIATTDNWILEMPGYKNGGSRYDNNRQILKADWIKQHIGEWNTVYRLSSSVRYKVADWADWRFYSSSHSTVKDRHVNYTIFTPLYGDFGNAYCSKLVYDAYYYGSGSLPVIQSYGSATIIAPGLLYDSFTSAYKPYLVGKY